MSDPSIDVVVFMKSAQVGATEILGNICGFYIDQDPAPMLLVQPTLEIGEAWSKDRLSPMVRDTASLTAKIGQKTRDGNQTLLHKTFPGGHLTIAGANSPSSLASRPIRVVLCDEVDRYPASAGSEGDPVELAFKRTTTFWSRKRMIASTPTTAGFSRIEKEWDRSDKRRYFVPCPDCGHEQALIWPQVQWPEGEPEKAQYVCVECGSAWDDARRWSSIANGHWVVTGEHTGIAGFHIWEAYSPWVRLGATAKAFVAAQGDVEKLKVFINTALGETWAEKGDAPDWERIYDRREDYQIGRVPDGGLLLTAGADVQHDRIEVSVWAWGDNKEKWLVEHRVLEGETIAPDVWDDLSSMLGETWRHESGAYLTIERIAVDSGDGSRTQKVYNWVRKHPGRAVAVKGANATVLVGLPKSADLETGRGTKKKRRGVRVYPVGHGVAKLELFGNLMLTRPTDEDLDAGYGYPEGYAHLPCVDSEYCKQLCSEQFVTKRTRQGYTKQEWQKMRERNEALDCYVYARAAASIVGIDRFSPAKWAELAANYVNTAAKVEKTSQKQTVNHPVYQPRDAGWFGDTGENWF